MENSNLESKNRQTVKWPPTERELKKEGYIQREIDKEPSTTRGCNIKQRLLDSRCMLDPEFSLLYTEEWKKAEGEPLLIRRARAYKYAIENITPVILKDELITMQKTRYMRGAPVYLQYSQKFYPHMISKAESADDDVYDVGMGGGRAHKESDEIIQMGTFGIKNEDVEPLLKACEYWQGKCIEDESDKFLKETMPEYDDLSNAFKAVLYPPINIVDSDMLRDAQRYLEKYRSLIVRVAGFSAYWVELAKPIQDEIIARTEYNATGF